MNSGLQRYTRTAIALHWLVALLIFVTFPLGVYMHDLPLSPNKLQLYSWHKWIGITILTLAVLRLLWRAGHTPPLLPEAISCWQRRASQGVHFFLYVLILAIPMSGWLMSSAKGFQTVWFGVLPLPDLVSKDKALGDLLTTVHQNLNLTLLIMVAIHVAAVLKHHFIQRNAILRRMLPFIKGGRP